MEYVKLGHTGLMASRLGFGCAAMGGYDYGPVDDNESIAAVRKAMDYGVTLFDTADVYGFGHSEEVLSRALGTARKNVVIATKFGVAWDGARRTRRDHGVKHLSLALEGSLRRLRLECIPLYLMHWSDGRSPLADTMEALERYREEGKIAAVGCCNVGPSWIDAASEYGQLAAIQLPYSLLDREADLTFRHARQRYGLSALTYNSLAQGLLTGKFGRDCQFDGTDLRGRSDAFKGAALEAALAVLERLRLVAKRYQRSPAQVAIRWVLQRIESSVVLTGLKRPGQAAENSGAFGWRLDDEDVEYLGSTALSGCAPSPQAGA